MKSMKCLLAISKSVARFSTSATIDLPRISPHVRSLKKNVTTTPPPFHTVSFTRYTSSLPNQPTAPTDLVFDGSSFTTEDKKVLEEALRKVFNFDSTTVLDPISTFGKLFVEWLMHEPPVPEELQFQQVFSVDGYEVYLDVCGFGEKDIKVYVEDRVLYVKADEKISLKGGRIKLDRSLPIHNFIFFDQEKGTCTLLHGELKVNFPFTGKFSAKKEGQIPVKWVNE